MIMTRSALANPCEPFCGTRSPRGFLRLGGLMVILALGLLIQGLSATPADAGNRVIVTTSGSSCDSTTWQQFHGQGTSCRDSLMVEIRRYSRMIADMRDSLSGGGEDIALSESQRRIIEKNIADISKVIEEIGVELSDLEFEIKDNTISLVNGAGEGIIINIPENLDEHLSEGLEILSKVILSELPDSIDFDQSRGWDWSGFVPDVPQPPRKVVQGNIIKVGEDLQIPARDDVRGDVVVVFGNAEISGRVDGSVVVVFGNLLLDETAEVTGKIVSVGGRLDQDPGADASDVVSVDLWHGGPDGGLAGIFGRGILAFLMCQGTFLLTVLLAVIAVVAVPRARFDAVIRTLRSSPGPALGLGLVTAIIGQMAVAVLMAVLVLTVIGIPLALLVFLALVMVVIISVAVCGAALGTRICAALGGGCSSPWLVVVVGMVALHLVSFLGSILGLSPGMQTVANVLVALGVIIKTLAFLLGVGALTISRFGSRKSA